MAQREWVIGVVVEEACLSVEQLAAACAVDPSWVLRLVDEGLFPRLPGSSDTWRFDVAALRRARRIRAVERDFDAAPELAALVADMLEELDALRSRR